MERDERTDSIGPAGIRAMACREATKLSEPSVERVARRLREHAGYNGSDGGIRGDTATIATNSATVRVSVISSVIASAWKNWRRGSESNRRIKVLQTSPLPLGYRASTFLV